MSNLGKFHAQSLIQINVLHLMYLQQLTNVMLQQQRQTSFLVKISLFIVSVLMKLPYMAVYVHCYGHLLNLALQDTMTHVEVLRNALGTVQSLYNFIEASPKRHTMFMNLMMVRRR